MKIVRRVTSCITAILAVAVIVGGSSSYQGSAPVVTQAAKAGPYIDWP